MSGQCKGDTDDRLFDAGFEASGATGYRPCYIAAYATHNVRQRKKRAIANVSFYTIPCSAKWQGHLYGLAAWRETRG